MFFTQRQRSAGFTLVEIVITLSIIGILMAVSIPSISAVQKEREARVPVENLILLIRETRSRAMKEGRPYQIAFDSTGFHAARYFNPYGKSEEFAKLQQDIQAAAKLQEMVDASKARGIDLNAGIGPSQADLEMKIARDGMQFSQKVELPNNYTYRLHFYDDSDWVDMSAGEFKRWIFQPSGMVAPLKIQIQADHAFFEVEFSPLTADVKTETGWVE